MGKSAPQPAPLPPVPPPPPPAPVQAVGETGGTSTAELIQGAKAVPTTPLDTATAGREEEMAQARKKGRKATKKTGPRGLLSPAQVKKKGLLGDDDDEVYVA
jgi:hypothetical protein